MKHYVLFVFCLLSVVGKAQSLLIWSETNLLQRVELTEKSTILIQDDLLIVRCNDVSLEYNLKSVHRFSFEGTSNKIKGVCSHTVHQNNDRIIVYGIASLEKISLYTLNGICVPVNIIHQGNNLIINISSIKHGIYLLTINGITTKIAKR